MKKLTIGLIGTQILGKTTLFNQLTGARQRVGNWAGVTVERKRQFSTTIIRSRWWTYRTDYHHRTSLMSKSPVTTF